MCLLAFLAFVNAWGLARGFERSCGAGRACATILIIVVDSQLLADFRELAQFSEEFIDGKVGYHEIFIFKGWCLGLAAHGDHGIHVFWTLVDVADVDVDAVTVKKGKCFAAPGAAGFNIKDRGCLFTHK